MTDLFGAAARTRPRPLADELRPTRLDEVFGQRRLLDPKGTFRRKVASGRLGTVILYGPSGVGKTTLARILGSELGKRLEELHPSRSSVADIRKLADEAKVRDLLVFVDEIHRFNAAQQDQLLSYSEEGLFDLVCSTTGNPMHVLTGALVSRATVFELEPLTPEDMEGVVMRGVAHVAGKGGARLAFAPGALAFLSARAGGDARRGLGLVENLSVGRAAGEAVTVDMAMAEEAVAASPVAHDRNGDLHYDIVSAWVKAMRGSDPDQAVYWLARLIHAGEDPRYIARRLLVHASEDVGLADNSVLATAAAALAAVQHVGYPEAQIVLSHATLHLARAPKSNSAYRAIHAAMDHVRKAEVVQVPPHMRDTHYKGARALGRGGYATPHDDPRGWVDQDHAPGVTPGMFYQSDARGGVTFEDRADTFWEKVTRKVVPRRFRPS